MELNNLPCLEYSSREHVIKLAIKTSLDLLIITKRRSEHARNKHSKQALEEGFPSSTQKWLAASWRQRIRKWQQSPEVNPED
jgi:hypothetical protein